MPTSPFRIAVIVACVERLVGPADADRLVSVVRSTTGLPAPDAVRACESGAEVLRSSGQDALRVPDSLIDDLVALLNSRSSGGARRWIESVAQRAGEPKATTLGDFIRWVRASVGATVSVGLDSLAPETERSEQPSPTAESEIACSAGRSGGGVADQGEPVIQPPPAPVELTFDDVWTEEGEHDLLADDAASRDFEIGVRADDGVESDDDVGDDGERVITDVTDDDIILDDNEAEASDRLLTDEAIDDLLADDSVDLDDDWMDDKPTN